MSKIPATVYAEVTPNPGTMKFVANRLMVPEGATVEFLSKPEARGYSDLADDLFNFPFVESVFFSRNFLSITKNDSIGWEMVQLQLREFIQDFLNQHEWAVHTVPLAEKANADSGTSATASGEPVAPSEYDDAIRHLLDEFVRPAVESDGGAIDFKSFHNGTVTVVLKGACSGCPSSTITLKNGIEQLLKSKLDVVQEVVAEEV